jgi:hypothetical protein
MRIEELKKAKAQWPFVPFPIRMADGREIEVRHPDAVAWDAGCPRTAVCVPPGGGWEVIDVALITSLGTPIPPRPKQKLRGRKRGK